MLPLRFKGFRSRAALLLGTVASCWADDGLSISRILDHTAEGCTTLPVAFTISDPNGAADKLSVMATSSNQALITDASILVLGIGTNRTLILPTRGLGRSIITLTVGDTDTAATATASFNLSTFACSGPPVVAPIADVRMNETGTVSVPLQSYFCDPCLNPTSIFWFARSDNSTLFPADNLKIVQDGKSATLILTPITNEIGHATIISPLAMVLHGQGGHLWLRSIRFSLVVRKQPAKDRLPFRLRAFIARTWYWSALRI